MFFVSFFKMCSLGLDSVSTSKSFGLARISLLSRFVRRYVGVFFDYNPSEQKLKPKETGSRSDVALF